MDRIRKFLTWWTIMIVAVAALALASEVGFDPFQSQDIKNNYMKGRLVLNLSIFNNPNSLAHSVVPSITMIFFMFYWKRNVIYKQIAAALMIFPLWCIYLTFSKGAFLSGFATVLGTLTFGKPKSAQVLIILLAFAFGWAALFKLPRMGELDKARSDEAIMGRIAAYKFGMLCLSTQKTGIGYGKWWGEFYKANHFTKGPHSSFNMVGAELGRPGLFLFLAIIYSCLRTLMTAKTTNDEQERLRRVLFVLVLSYGVSSWMIDFGYRPIFFMITATTAAFHRQLWGIKSLAEEEEHHTATLSPSPLARFPLPFNPVPQAATVSPPPDVSPPSVKAPQVGVDITAESESSPAFWNRIGFRDIVLILVLNWGVVRYWNYIIYHL
jgi:hypothetical protein